MTILLGRYRKEDADAQEKVIWIEAERRVVLQQAKKLLEPQGAGQGKEGFSSRALERAGPCCTFSKDFWHPEL